VSYLFDLPASAQACYVFAHGAGAGMEHGFMANVAGGLAQRGVATLRFQFPFMVQGSRRPDPPAVAHAAVRAAVVEAARRAPGLPLFAGGKSYGGRMTSQAQALEPLPLVRGLVCVGFPLHPSGKPSVERAAHLAAVRIPMLFDLVRGTVASLGQHATLHVLEGADHAFHVLVRSGRNDTQLREELLDAMADWMKTIAAPSGPAA
jgi:predicted alpha/beta-hydrolase family hydrolase